MELTAGAIEKIKSGDIANDAVTVQVQQNFAMLPQAVSQRDVQEMFVQG